ncbi:hypothetical protein [Algoriphagus sp.]|nr:hypothetical protein [Algoriphagus sp.]
MTQEPLAERVGTTKSFISKIKYMLKKPEFRHFKKLVNLVLEANLKPR